jgi:hypothetical protein
MQLRRFDWIEQVPYLSITRYPLYAKQTLRVVVPFLALHIALMGEK